MKAIEMVAHGGPEVLRYVDRADPEPGPGQVRIRVEAAAVNWSDVVRRRGGLYPFPTPLPFVPGSEVAGTVDARGPGVDGLAPGTHVFALAGGTGAGGYAEFAVAEAVMVLPRPASVTPECAAGILVAGGTAMLLLQQAARLVPGEAVLVEGAGGGVGSFAVQLARRFGAGLVVAAAGTPARRAAALALGADHAVDYTAPGWQDSVRDLTGGRGVDVALETVGAGTLGAAWATLAPFGRMVVYGLAGGVPGALSPDEQRALFYAPAENRSVAGFNLGTWFAHRAAVAGAALAELVGLVASGEVCVPVSEQLPLAEAAKAHEMLEARAVTGKVVLRPW